MATELLSTEEERLWRAALLARNYALTERPMTLRDLLTALSSDQEFDKAMESEEERLSRQLEQERTHLRSLHPQKERTG
jgi:hypothetical protein